MTIFDIHKDGRTIFSTAWRSSAEMVRQGYKDARRKRYKVGGTVPRVWKDGDVVTAAEMNTEILLPGALRKVLEAGYEPIEVTTFGDDTRRYVRGLPLDREER